MKIKILEYLIIFALILTLISMGFVIYEITQSHDASTYLSYAGIVIGLASFLITMAIRYSDIIRSRANDFDFTSVKEQMNKIENAITDTKSTIDNNSKKIEDLINDKVENKNPIVENSLLSINFTIKEDLTK